MSDGERNPSEGKKMDYATNPEDQPTADSENAVADSTVASPVPNIQRRRTISSGNDENQDTMTAMMAMLMRLGGEMKETARRAEERAEETARQTKEMVEKTAEQTKQEMKKTVEQTNQEIKKTVEQTNQEMKKIVEQTNQETLSRLDEAIIQFTEKTKNLEEKHKQMGIEVAQLTDKQEKIVSKVDHLETQALDKFPLHESKFEVISAKLVQNDGEIDMVKNKVVRIEAALRSGAGTYPQEQYSSNVDPFRIQIKSFRGMQDPQHPIEFIKELELKLEREFVTTENQEFKRYVRQYLEGRAREWFEVLENRLNNFQEFKTAFINYFWGPELQDQIYRSLIATRTYNPRYGTLSEHFIYWFKKVKFLDITIPEATLIRHIFNHYPEPWHSQLQIWKPSHAQEALDLLSRIDNDSSHRDRHEMYVNQNYQGANFHENYKNRRYPQQYQGGEREFQATRRNFNEQNPKRDNNLYRSGQGSSPGKSNPGPSGPGREQSGNDMPRQ